MVVPGPNAARTVAVLRDRLGYGGGLALYYACIFFVMGAAMPYLNPWLASQGLSVSEIATVATVSAVARIIAGPLVGLLADRWQAPRQVLIWSAWASFLAWVLLGQGQVFWQFIVAQFLVAATGAGLMPLAETIAVAGTRSHGIDYGRVRLWGSVAFIAATLIAGILVDHAGIAIAIWILCTAALLAALATALLPLPAAPQRRTVPRLVDTLTLLRAPPLLLFLLTVALAQASHATLYVFSTLHWQAQGLSNTWCGALWSLGVIAEVVLFWFAPQITSFAAPLRLLALGLGAGVVRWAAMGFDPPLALLIPLQMLHALTFGATHLGAMQHLAKTVPLAQSGTVQSLYALVTGGIGGAVAIQIAGHTYAAGGGRAYWAMAALCALGLASLALLQRHINGREGPGSGPE